MNIFQTYLNVGISVLPCNGKIPAISGWKDYQKAYALQDEASGWRGNIGAICGAISGGLVCIDFDIKNGDMWDEWTEVVVSQYPELMSKLVIEITPSGGKHVIFRTETMVKNIKLACNSFGAVMIETRGEGGYFVCSPSIGYDWYYSDITQVQRISKDETDFILSVSRSFDQLIKDEPKQPPAHISTTGNTPLDDYNSKADIVELLERHGWKTQFRRNETIYFKRPGKDERGISASWNHIPDRFYVFTTSTAFENSHIYKKSAVYAILECNGDYSAAAKRLYADGYGDRIKNDISIKIESPVVLIDTQSVKSKIYDIYKNGYKRGLTTGWNGLDEYYSVVKGQFTVITGMPSMGKSEVMDALSINLAKISKWKFVVFSPENYPVEMHYHKLIEKICNKKMSAKSGMTGKEIDDAVEFIDKHFFFIDALENDVNLDMIINSSSEIIDKHGCDGMIIDPWNEIELCKPKGENDSDYIGNSLRTIRKFTRKKNTHLWIVAHPTKMTKDKKGEYSIPELYDIMGSSHWRNKADNGLCVHRNLVENTEIVSIYIQKIKFRYCGKMGKCNLIYNGETGNYADEKKEPFKNDW